MLDFFFHIQKALSYTNLTSQGLLQKRSTFYKIAKSLYFLISDARASEITEYSMEKYNSCYPDSCISLQC